MLVSAILSRDEYLNTEYKNQPDTTKLLHAVRYAAHQHRTQKRKGPDGSPYINHPVEAAEILTSIGGITDIDVLRAAVLHDTVEDTDSTKEELTQEFSPEVAALVMEVTDNKSLPKAERKRLQIEHTRTMSHGARLIKIADKICNVREVLHSPPDGWVIERRREYVEWAAKVVDGCRGSNTELEKHFDTILQQAREAFAPEE